MNFYEFLTVNDTRSLISGAIKAFWEEKVRDKWDKRSCEILNLSI